ncbi:hypothetical protein PQI23_13300, partial [Leucobacter sp. USCH14]|uniref:hypothetical protein n=1 Tax=Leucobacter sp. USCH14 TaxID=3024838 RepID=UPI0030983C33
MTVSPLANMKYDIPALDRWQPRQARIAGVLIHHNAGVDAYGQATAPGREVSANYWITNGSAARLGDIRYGWFRLAWKDDHYAP